VNEDHIIIVIEDGDECDFDEMTKYNVQNVDEGT
jgi:hypothetical protein